MIDPLTAVSLASAIVTFVEASQQVLKRIEDFQGSIEKVPHCLHDVHAQLKLLTATLSRTKEKADSSFFSNETRGAVLGVVIGCQSQVTNLVAIIDKLLPRPADSKWTKSKKALLSIKSEKRMQHIESCLQRYTQSLTYHEAANIPSFNQGQKASSGSDNTQIVFDIPFSRDADFIGREDILLKTSQHFQQKTQAAFVPIGGVGKSQVAIEYCYRFRQHHSHACIFWINASSADRFEQGYKRIARRLELPGWNDYAVDPFELVKDWFESEAGVDWLLVLDGLDDMETIFPSRLVNRSILKYIPKVSSGRLLLTSRDRRIGTRLFGLENTFKLAEPALSEATALFYRKLAHCGRDRSGLESLTEELSCLPLAITQAAAYINESYLDVQTYRQLLQEERRPAEILDEELGDVRRCHEADGCGSSVFRTFEISFDRLLSQNERAAELLAFIGTLEGCAVPIFLLQDTDNAINAPCRSALTLLESLSLIVFQRSREVLSLHKLVHLCVRRWLRLNRRTRQWHREAALQILKRFPRFHAFDWAEKGVDQWATCEVLLPHASLLLKNADLADQDSTLCKKLHVLVVKYKGQRNWREPIANEIDSIRSYFGATDLKWYFRTCDELVLLRREQGRYGEAVQILETALQAAERLSLTRHATVLQAQLELAHCLYHLGDLDRAFAVAEDTREASGRAGDDEDSFRQHRCDEIVGMIKGTEGDIENSTRLFANVVKWKVEKFGPRHRTTLNSRRNLFNTLVKGDDLSSAEAMGRDLLTAFDQVQGPSHPRTLLTRVILAETCMFLGKAKEAEGLALDSITQSSERLKTPVQGSALLVLLGSYWIQGRMQETVKLEERLLVLANRTIEDQEGDILALFRLAMFGRYLHRRGRGATSRRLLQNIVYAQEQASAEDIDINATKRLLADVEHCTCRAVDVTVGCWQPRCKWRVPVFEGVINLREIPEALGGPNTFQSRLWTQKGDT